MSMKKTLAGIASYALVGAVALGIGGTLAYEKYQTPSAVNTFVAGDIEIEQLEYQRADGVSHINTGAKDGELVPFVQKKMIMPAVPLNDLPTDYTAEGTDLFNWGVYSPGGNGLWNDNKLSNVMDKFVFVKNTGDYNCYYRTVFAFECPDGSFIGEPTKGADFMINTNGNYRFTWEHIGYTNIDGARYSLWTATYNEELTPKETSRPSLLQVVMTHNADNDVVKALGEEYDIKVISQAVQTSGFEDGVATASTEEQAVKLGAKEMLNRAFGEITPYVHPWTDAVVVESEEEFEQALEAEENTIDIVLKDGEYTTNLSIPGGKDVTISGSKDVVLKGQIASTSSTAGTLYLNGVTVDVDDTIKDSTGISQTGKSAIAIWGNQNVVCENVTFNMSLADSTAITSWWNTGVGTTIEVRNCTFNCNGQRPIRSTANVTVENCTFNDPYRYAVQMTAKDSTATELENAVVNFNNNTIIDGDHGKPFVYGVQLEGETYGCSNLIINGSGNKIVADDGDGSTMYYCECGKVDHNTVVFNTEVEPVHAKQ